MKTSLSQLCSQVVFDLKLSGSVWDSTVEVIHCSELLICNWAKMLQKHKFNINFNKHSGAKHILWCRSTFRFQVGTTCTFKNLMQKQDLRNWHCLSWFQVRDPVYVELHQKTIVIRWYSWLCKEMFKVLDALRQRCSLALLMIPLINFTFFVISI